MFFKISKSTWGDISLWGSCNVRMSIVSYLSILLDVWYIFNYIYILIFQSKSWTKNKCLLRCCLKKPGVFLMFKLQHVEMPPNLRKKYLFNWVEKFITEFVCLRCNWRWSILLDIFGRFPARWKYSELIMFEDTNPCPPALRNSGIQ